MNTRQLLNNFIIPEEVVIKGQKVNPLDLTRKANVQWLYDNLHVANSKNPLLSKVLTHLKGLLFYGSVSRYNHHRRYT